MKSKIPIIVFLAVLFTPIINNLITRGDNQFSLSENRKLVTGIDLKGTMNFKEVTKQFSSYVNDQFFGRDFLIKIYNTIYFIAKTPRDDKFIFGKDGWIFWTANEGIEQFKGTFEYEEKDLRNLFSELKIVQSYCEEERNIPFYFFVAPSKSFCYSEFLPDHLSKSSAPKDNLDLFHSLIKREGINYIDMFKMLDKAKSDLLYQPKNSHWNQTGAFQAYSGLIDEIELDYPGIKENLSKGDISKKMIPKTQEFFRTRKILFDKRHKELEPHYLINSTDQKKYWFDNSLRPSEWDYESKIKELMPQMRTSIYENPKVDGPSILFIRDSFGNDMLDFLCATFPKVIATHHFFSKWNNEMIENLNPDIVIYQVAQRSLHRFKDENKVFSLGNSRFQSLNTQEFINESVENLFAKKDQIKSSFLIVLDSMQQYEHSKNLGDYIMLKGRIKRATGGLHLHEAFLEIDNDFHPVYLNLKKDSITSFRVDIQTSKLNRKKFKPILWYYYKLTGRYSKTRFQEHITVN